MSETQEALVAAMQNCENKLSVISEIVSDHFGTHPDHVTWANVGDANHVSELLDEIMEFTGCKEIE